MDKNDVYSISGRIKNILAREDIALSPVGNVLINYFTLTLKNLYDFSETIPENHKLHLQQILESSESIPATIIKVSTSGMKTNNLYQETMKSKALFDTNKDALDHLVNEYNELGNENGMTGDEFWIDAESTSKLTEDHLKILILKRRINMCEYLIKKGYE